MALTNEIIANIRNAPPGVNVFEILPETERNARAPTAERGSNRKRGHQQLCAYYGTPDMNSTRKHRKIDSDLALREYTLVNLGFAQRTRRRARQRLRALGEKHAELVQPGEV